MPVAGEYSLNSVSSRIQPEIIRPSVTIVIKLGLKATEAFVPPSMVCKSAIDLVSSVPASLGIAQFPGQSFS